MNKQLQRIIVTVIAFLCYAGYQYITTGNLPSFNSRDYGNRANTTEYSSDAAILAGLQSKKIIYTKHAKCRMDCRTISEKEVRAVLNNGKVNHRKSEQQSGKCPTYAIESYTKDGQEVRIVFADCADVTKVVTTIDLGKKYNCYCE